MAYTFLKKEIICSLCLAMYADPVMLHCGHSFCSGCIKTYISEQSCSGTYRCPECKQTSKTNAPLSINTKLQSIALNWKSVENHFRLGEASCTYCLQYPIPAVKICLHCESFMCAKHLEVHSKKREHLLDDVTSTLKNRICSTHCEILKFFCMKEKTLICTSCLTGGDHRGHVVELLEVASCQRREELQEIVNNMHTELKTLKKKANDLKNVISRNKEKAKKVTAEVRSLCCSLLDYMREVAANLEADIKLEDMEVFEEASDEMVSLEKKEEQLSEEIRQIEAMCNQDDPVLVLQNKPHHKLQTLHQAGLPLAVQFDSLLVSLKFQKSFESFAKSIQMQLTSQCFHIKCKVDVLLNSSTASNYLRVSANRKAVTYRSIRGDQNKPKSGQFKTSNVLSELSFSSGKHYWEVKVGKNGVKSVGVAYPSIMKSGPEAFLGYNKQSWCLTWSESYMVACFDSRCWKIPCDKSSISSVAVYLDYDLGTLSFYRICSPVELLFTFTTKFTKPLHAAFYVVNSWIKINP
ncbi:tripartite motif-containing protein 60-like [Eleutherodactylus coqui]|uniref:tripartite motif-containing protein 60-like n=1 Tax=Eleutherodactylus coqui TaxID=57060 RepID=UPI0034624C23